MPRRIPAPPPGKILVGFDEIPAWVYTFSVDDSFDMEYASDEEIRAAYLDWQRRSHEWKDAHELPSLAEAAAVPAKPWDEALI